jgi:hypothetical protein
VVVVTVDGSLVGVCVVLVIGGVEVCSGGEVLIGWHLDLALSVCD